MSQNRPAVLLFVPSSRETTAVELKSFKDTCLGLFNDPSPTVHLAAPLFHVTAMMIAEHAARESATCVIMADGRGSYEAFSRLKNVLPLGVQLAQFNTKTGLLLEASVDVMFIAFHVQTWPEGQFPPGDPPT